MQGLTIIGDTLGKKQQMIEKDNGGIGNHVMF